ncbi:MAG: hypothetical protein ABI551_27750 [Polyangiaceae bacterium]
MREDGEEDEGYQEDRFLDAAEQARLLAAFDTAEWEDDRPWYRKAEKWIAQFAFTTGFRQASNGAGISLTFTSTATIRTSSSASARGTR